MAVLAIAYMDVLVPAVLVIALLFVLVAIFVIAVWGLLRFIHSLKTHQRVSILLGLVVAAAWWFPLVAVRSTKVFFFVLGGNNICGNQFGPYLLYPVVGITLAAAMIWLSFLKEQE